MARMPSVPLLRRPTSCLGDERAVPAVRRPPGECLGAGRCTGRPGTGRCTGGLGAGTLHGPARHRPLHRAVSAPDFELDVPKRPAPKVVAPRKVEEEVKLELAVEPRSFAPIVADRESNAVTLATTAAGGGRRRTVSGLSADRRS